MRRASVGPQEEVDLLAGLGSLTVWKEGRLLPGHGARSALDRGLLFGIPTSVERLTPGDFYTADEAFLTGTATGIVAIGSVDGRRLTSAPGSMSGRLIGAYRATWAEPAFATTL